MDWRYLQQHILAGMPKTRRVFTLPSDCGIRFLVVDGKGKLVYTATYASAADGERQLPQDYAAHQGVAVADGCLLCGRVIETTNPRAKFCSRACQKRHGARQQTKRKAARRAS